MHNTYSGDHTVIAVMAELTITVLAIKAFNCFTPLIYSKVIKSMKDRNEPH